ncbi:HIT family protein [Halolamina sp.]|jgi:histidine triad (HIT) family protein|uniref:HIT family protein n=1 Tax=Halolamina sp. TaxID=1940283 RepID=UPI000223C022|nr:histidine triad (HIT) protein [halophilic archaeon DL31]
MAEDCIFCSIVTGDIPGRIVHETDHAIAFLDANPLAAGHTLVVPKQHYSRVEEIPGDEAAELFGVVHDLVPKVEAAVDADAVSVGINDGEAAGQEIPHSHVHLVPRFNGDGGGPFHAIAPQSDAPSDDELDEIAAAISGD